MSHGMIVVNVLFITLQCGAGLRMQHERDPGQKQCIAFQAQHKSAGLTIIKTLRKEPLKNFQSISKQYDCDERTFNYETRKCVPASEQAPPAEKPYVLSNGWTLSMAKTPMFDHDHCAWITMFREPVARLVSAYFHCQKEPKDPLCGSMHLKASTASLHEFADHWGNYLFRELLFYPPLFNNALPVSEKSCDALCEAHKEVPHDNLWYKWKRALQLNGGESITTPPVAANLANLKKHFLGTEGVARMFDAFGVVEQWEKSMAIFDRVAPLEGQSWLDATSKHHWTHGSETTSKEESELIQKAKNDPSILEKIAIDLEVYNKIVLPAFDQQTQ